MTFHLRCTARERSAHDRETVRNFPARNKTALARFGFQSWPLFYCVQDTLISTDSYKQSTFRVTDDWNRPKPHDAQVVNVVRRFTRCDNRTRTECGRESFAQLSFPVLRLLCAKRPLDRARLRTSQAKRKGDGQSLLVARIMSAFSYASSCRMSALATRLTVAVETLNGSQNHTLRQSLALLTR